MNTQNFKMAKRKIPQPSTRKPATTDAEKVMAYLQQLDHPLKPEIEQLRTIVKSAHPQISERIKWNAPSYYTSADLLTFNLRPTQHVHLVFHHPAIVQIQSPLLEGDYKDRRMAYFANMEAVLAHQPELERIVKEYVSLVETS